MSEKDIAQRHIELTQGRETNVFNSVRSELYFGDPTILWCDPDGFADMDLEDFDNFSTGQLKFNHMAEKLGADDRMDGVNQQNVIDKLLEHLQNQLAECDQEIEQFSAWKEDPTAIPATMIDKYGLAKSTRSEIGPVIERARSLINEYVAKLTAARSRLEQFIQQAESIHTVESFISALREFYLGESEAPVKRQ